MYNRKLTGVKENTSPAPLVQNRGIVKRTSVPLDSPVDGLYPYNNRLFDLETEDSILAFSLTDAPDSFFEAFPISNSNVWKHSEAFLTYVGGAGTSTSTAGNGAHADACADPECIEAGYVHCEVEGFGRMRRCGFSRDMTQANLRYTEIEPIYDIGGNRIESDFEYDSVRMAGAMIQDINNGFFTFDSVNAGEFDGLLQWVTTGYTDPKTGNPHPEMDSYVVGWNANPVCDFNTGLSATINVNGATIPVADLTEFSLVDLIRDYAARIQQRIHMSTASGAFQIIAAADPQLIRCIMDCWVCYTVCGRDITRMNSKEARQYSEELRAQITDFGVIQLTIDGISILFYPWLWDGLYDSGTETYSLFMTVPQIGNRNVWDIEFLDLQASFDTVAQDVPSYQELRTMDNGRWAKWSKQEHLCIQPFMETRLRVRTCAPWVSMIVNGIACGGNIFGRISKSVLDADYLGGANLELAETFN